MKNYLKGSYEDYMGLDEDYLKADKQRLKDIILKLSPTANRRLDRLKKNDMKSPAYRSVMEGKSGSGVMKKGRFGGVENKSVTQLLAEYKRINNFLDDETSTVSGYQGFLDKMTARLGFKGGYYENKKEVNRLWDLYNRSKELKPILKYGGSKEYDSTQRIKDIFEKINDGWNNTEILKFINEGIDDILISKSKEQEEAEEFESQEKIKFKGRVKEPKVEEDIDYKIKARRNKLKER